MKKITNLIFDLDGTLFSSTNIIRYAYEKSISKLNKKYPKLKISTPHENEIIKLIGLPANQIIQKIFPKMTSEKKIKLKSLILESFLQKIKLKKGYLFEGVLEILNDLYKKNYQLFIASNGLRIYIETILTTYNLLSLFKPLVVINEKNILSKTDILLTYQKNYNLTKKNTVMIGDRNIDFQSAKKLNYKFIACLYGYGNKTEFKESSIMINSFAEILNWI